MRNVSANSLDVARLHSSAARCRICSRGMDTADASAKPTEGPLMSRLRQNINIELADGAKDQLERVRSRNGMTQKELVARLINWFSQQDHVVQQIILGQIPQEVAPDVAKLMLERIADAAPAAREAAAAEINRRLSRGNGSGVHA